MAWASCSALVMPCSLAQSCRTDDVRTVTGCSQPAALSKTVLQHGCLLQAIPAHCCTLSAAAAGAPLSKGTMTCPVCSMHPLDGCQERDPAEGPMWLPCWHATHTACTFPQAVLLPGAGEDIVVGALQHTLQHPYAQASGMLVSTHPQTQREPCWLAARPSDALQAGCWWATLRGNVECRPQNFHLKGAPHVGTLQRTLQPIAHSHLARSLLLLLVRLASCPHPPPCPMTSTLRPAQGTHLGKASHVGIVVVGAAQPVVEQAVHQSAVPHAQPCPGSTCIIGHVAHGLHSPCDHHVTHPCRQKGAVTRKPLQQAPDTAKSLTNVTIWWPPVTSSPDSPAGWQPASENLTTHRHLWVTPTGRKQC